MALITKTFTWTVGTLIVASEHNTNFDTIYNDYNGNITNANISSSAAITDAKLAQISTASKINSAALTLLANVPSGAGLLPIANIPALFQVVSATRNTALAAGTQGILLSGTNFTPNSAIILAAMDNSNKSSWGIDDGFRAFCVASAGTSRYLTDSTNSIRAINLSATSGTTEYKGKFSSFNSTGGVITWLKSGTPAGTLQLYIGFMK